MVELATAGRVRQFTIGLVLSASFGILLRNIVPFSIIAAVLAIPYIVFSLTQQTINAPQIAIAHSISIFYANTLGNLAVHTATSLLTSAALAYGTFQNLRNQRATAWQSLRHGFSRPATVLLGTMAFTFLYCLGFILLLVPALLILVAFWLYMPAVVLEKKDIAGGFQRSRELTKGRRWLIFGLLTLVGIVAGLAAAGEAILFKGTFGYMGTQYIAMGLEILYNAFSAVMVTVGYYYLRADREGVAVGEIADVFG